jgi:membrane protein DedA with SNARE-associated domain
MSQSRIIGDPMNLFTNFIEDYGLAALFMIILLEYACFPVSSEIVLPFAGAVSALQNTNFLVILLLSILAGLIGTGLCFTVGWFGGGAILTAISKKFPKAGRGIASATAKFNDNGAYAVCIGRVIPLIRTYIALVAGAARLNPVTYFTYSALGITVWNTLLIGLGYTLQSNYNKVAGYYSQYKHNLRPVAIIFSIILLINFIYQRIKKRKSLTGSG